MNNSLYAAADSSTTASSRSIKIAPRSKRIQYVLAKGRSSTLHWHPNPYYRVPRSSHLQTDPTSVSSGTTPNQGEAQAFLIQLKRTWDDHVVCLGMVRDILMYLDRTYVKSNNVPSVYEMGLDTFRDVVIQSSLYDIQSYIVSTLLNQIQLERDGQSVDRMLLKSTIDMLLTLPATSSSSGRVITTLYNTAFERLFLSTSQTFYSRESELLLKECDAIQFLKRAKQRLEEENARAKHYIHDSTRTKIQSIAEKELLENNIRAILEMESGLSPIVANDRIEDLKCVYSLFSRASNGHSELRAGIAAIIKQSGIAINHIHAGCTPLIPSSSTSTSFSASASLHDMQAAVDKPMGQSETIRPSTADKSAISPIVWVDAMISLKDKFDVFLEKCFDKHKSFQNEINAAMEMCINLNPKCPEFLSLFVDDNLRKGIKGKSEEEVEQFLEKAVSIFRFVREKDVFERYYNQHLAKRLLYGRSISHDTEKTMISKLKAECGRQFISKLEGMFKDMHISDDLAVGYRTFQTTTPAASSSPLPELFVHTLTNTFWPISVPAAMNACLLPPEILDTMDHFQRYYMTLHSGRQLTWLKHMGTADLRAHFNCGRKELNVSTYSMVVLMTHFSDMSSNLPTTFQQIIDATDIPIGDLTRTLQSLSLGKYRILIKSTKGKLIHKEDTFTINAAFTSPLSKIKILTIAAASSSSGSSSTLSTTGAVHLNSNQGAADASSAATATNSVETDAERAYTLDRVAQDRKHQIEACIVRIMKSRKSLRHNELVSLVISQLSTRFSPDPLVVKTRIEGAFRT
ncbi:hypothetical protein BSLG_010378 [Batrachochytrium salamandrivorans]|nr:hypothetical protein BSLG_010378 [Batrachochytrium salamandrivorans]